MPILNHKLLDPKVKFLAVFKPSDFHEGGDLFNFPNVISLMDIRQIGREKVLRFDLYNPKIDSLPNQTHRKYLKDLHQKISSKIAFPSNNFAIKNKCYTFFDLIVKFSPSFMTGALKKIARKMSGQNNPPPPSWISRKKDEKIFPPLPHFQNSFSLTIHKKFPPSMRSFHYDYLSRVAPSLTKLVQFKNSGFVSAKCPRPECTAYDLTADSEHIVYDCVFASSILFFLKHAHKDEEIDYKVDDLFYLFPFIMKKKYNLSLELFILFSQIKITAFRVITADRFSSWNFNHFYVQLLKILKTSIKICELYNIPIKILHSLLDYAERAAIGLLHAFLYDYPNLYIV